MPGQGHRAGFDKEIGGLNITDGEGQRAQHGVFIRGFRGDADDHGDVIDRSDGDVDQVGHHGVTIADGEENLAEAEGDTTFTGYTHTEGTGKVIAEIYDATPTASFTATTPPNATAASPRGPRGRAAKRAGS